MKKQLAILAALMLGVCGCQDSGQDGGDLPGSESVSAFSSSDSASASKSTDMTGDMTDSFVANQLKTYTDDKMIIAEIRDYDGDGEKECFAVCGKDDGSGIFYECALYFITKDKLTVLSDDLSGYANGVLTFGDDQFFLWEISGGGSGSITAVYGVKDGEPFEPAVSRQGMCLKADTNGEPVYLHSTFDHSYEQGNYVGHTWKPYWLYYNREVHEFYEYGGTEIALEQFMALKNAQNVIDMVGENELGKIYVRKNGVINVNYKVYPQEANSYSNYHITARYMDEEIVSVDEEEDHSGFYLPAMCPDLVIDPDTTDGA